MTRYVDRKYVVRAVQFDGSDVSALAAIKEIGGDLTLCSNGGELVLSLSKCRVMKGDWVLHRQGNNVAIPAQEFAETYTPIDESPAPRAAPPVVFPGVPAGSFTEGDHVIEIGDFTKDKLTILEIDNGILVCDSPWGEKRLAPSKVRLIESGDD